MGDNNNEDKKSSNGAEQSEPGQEDKDFRQDLFERVEAIIENQAREENQDTNLNAIFEPNQPSTSQGVQHDSTLPNDQITNSITVYNSENALCTILTDGRDTENIVKSTQNSVILVFTHLLNRLSSGNLNQETAPSTSVRNEGPKLPDYAAVKNTYKVTVNRDNIVVNPPVNIPEPPLYGAPPSYSAVLRFEQPNRFTRQNVRNQPSPPFLAPPPPPSYAEVQGNYSTREVLATFDEYIWGPDPILIYCPRCATIVQTTTQYHRSTLTHFSALALCLCGCWPCCLLPYCMKSCKNTYHYCPHCQSFLGMYSPW